MAISIETHQFQVPTRAVLCPEDIDKWEKSEAYQDLLGFMMSLNDSVRGKSCSSPCHESDVIHRLLAMLDKLSKLLEEFPPIEQPQRYGNKAFRDYYARVAEVAESLVSEVVGAELSASASEVSVYLVESLGNSTRIDYGTGHELSFLMFLTCLFKIGALKKDDAQAAVNKVFKRNTLEQGPGDDLAQGNVYARGGRASLIIGPTMIGLLYCQGYLDLARQLQSVYKMEPAGSQGVWSLDDYQFVPFIWGSSQLVMNPKIAPEMFTSKKVVDENAEDFIFLACIKFILEVKTGPFAEHSNQLWNISGVQSWAKINQGLIKMYKAEVLHKFPVVQHVLFGSLLTMTPATAKVPAPAGPMGLRGPGLREATVRPAPPLLTSVVSPSEMTSTQHK